MLTSTSPNYLHLAQSAALILLSLLLLPISNTLLVLSYLISPFLSTHNAIRTRNRRSSSFRPRTILVTGVGMSKGLTLARTFYLAGHNVIGADFEPWGIPVGGRYSRALKEYYPLPKPNEIEGSTLYIQELLRVVRRQKVDLWVSCSGVASAVEDGQAKEVLEKRPDCRCIQLDVPTTRMLHEKDTFIQETARLGLPTPETHNVTSRAAVHRVLHESPRTKKRYIMKSVGMDDASRTNIMTVLPRRTLSETYNHLAAVPISDTKPWVLQQFVQGREYCTHALVIDNTVRAFVACPSLELLMHYEALPAEDPLSKAILRFTKAFVQRSNPSMTGHVSFDFLVEEKIKEGSVEINLLPIECNPRAHTAVILFHGREKEMAEAYLTACAPRTNGHIENHEHVHSEEDSMKGIVIPLPQTNKYYWIGHDLVTLILYPFLLVLLRKITVGQWISNVKTFLEHFLLWKDGTYEFWDPLPAWWLYHIYWPGHFLAAIVLRRRWSRVNVSTGKMFMC